MYLQKINLKNKYALVTGAGKGLGKACSIALAEAGATVIALSRTPSDLDKLEKQMVYVGDYDVIGTQILYCNSNGDLIDGHPNLEFSDNNIKSVTKRGNNQIANFIFW